MGTPLHASPTEYCLHLACHALRLPWQGFEKYGVGAFDAVPTPHLQKALNLKSGTRGVQPLLHRQWTFCPIPLLPAP